MDKIDEGYVRLLCAIGVVRSWEYRKAYYEYLKKPNSKNLAQVRYWEDMLRDPLTNLDDSEIRRIQRDVKENGLDYRYDMIYNTF